MNGYFREWMEPGLLDVLYDTLRDQCREKNGKKSPAVAIIDSQAVKTTEQA